MPRWPGPPMTDEQKREAQRLATQRWYRSTHPKPTMPARTSEEIFMSHVDKIDGDGCWIWTGSRRGVEVKNGHYGGFWKDGKSVLAHRMSYELFVGPIPEGMFVLHKCDVPLCVKPEHLWLGTQAQNMQDAIRKGRLDRKALAAGFTRDDAGRFSGGT